MKRTYLNSLPISKYAIKTPLCGLNEVGMVIRKTHPAPKPEARRETHSGPTTWYIAQGKGVRHVTNSMRGLAKMLGVSEASICIRITLGYVSRRGPLAGVSIYKMTDNETASDKN